MKVTKQQLRQMACVIGGGHKYADTDLLLAVDTKKKVCEYSNKCVRCGKEYHVEVPLQYVLPENLTDTYRKRVEKVDHDADECCASCRYLRRDKCKWKCILNNLERDIVDPARRHCLGYEDVRKGAAE